MTGPDRQHLTREKPGALVPREEPSWKVASSLESSRVGEVMLLDRHGHVLSPRKSRIWSAWGWARVGTLAASLGVLGTVLFGSAAFGLICAATFSGAVGWQLRHQPALKRALALAASGQREDARAAFEELESRDPPAAYRATIDTQLGGVLWLLGEHAEALERYEAAIARYRRSRRHDSHPGYWVCAFNRAQLLACMGEVEGAAKMARGLDGAPTGEYFHMERLLTELLLAFHADEPESLEGDLYDWARDALATNRMGLTVVLLAWAFNRRGDADMARHMLREAPSRLEGYYLSDSAPRVHAWMEHAFRDWDMAPDPSSPL